MNIPRLSTGDPGSYSNPEEISVSHMDITFDIDFSSNIFKGNVTLTVQKHLDNITQLILDSRNLHVKEVLDIENQTILNYTIGDPVHTFGSKLSIDLPKTSSKKLLIKIEYETDKHCTALQWLLPEQTAGKKYPYVFSQCQPDHCRSIVPCQDTPSVKATYTAAVTVSQNFTVLMSALKAGEPTTEKNKKIFYFTQPVSIPAYLIAIAVGNLESRKLGSRSNVWAEPEIVEQAAYEFAETDIMLKTAEDICGPYVWKQYDILVLPPSFPFGGMENPCLTFITPTLLTGDRSLVSVVAHEIAHSWTGNLISIKNFEHFWLNEGFTMFIERKINGRLKGESYRHFCAIGGLKDLRQSVNTLGETNPLTKLVVDLTGVDPDDAFSTCPYEKGHTFLFYLEELLGGPDKFESFLRSYFTIFKYQSVNTDDFKKYLNSYFAGENNLNSIDWDLWLNSCGMPPIIPQYDTTLQEVCKKLANQWCDWKFNESSCPFTEDDVKMLKPEQIEEFCALLLEKDSPLEIEKLIKMNELYRMNSIKNYEIRFRWLRICIKSRWEKQIDLALQLITEQGRMKYVRPIFKDLCCWDKAREKAVQTFHEHRSCMMHVLVRNLENDLMNSTPCP